MNSVEYVKKLCKERGIAISKLEKELGFSNGYIAQLRKGSFPAERASAIAKYLDISMDELLNGGENKKQPTTEEGDELNEILEACRERSDLRMLFKLSKGATAEDVRQAIKIIQALREDR